MSKREALRGGFRVVEARRAQGDVLGRYELRQELPAGGSVSFTGSDDAATAEQINLDRLTAARVPDVLDRGLGALAGAARAAAG